MKKKPFFLRPMFMGGFVIFLMIFSVIAIVLTEFNTDESELIEYNGYTFYPGQYGWFTRVNNIKYDFNYAPDELENISYVPINSAVEKMYFAYDPTVKNISIGYPSQRIAAHLNGKNVRIVQACTQEENCPDVLPIIDCSNATAPVLLFAYNEITGMSKREQCVVIQGSSNQELYKVTERFIYNEIGVMT